MHGQFITIFIALVCIGNINPQNNSEVVKGEWPTQLFFTDMNGSSFENKYTEINNSPYFNEVYKFADIKLRKGRVFNNVKTRINLVIQAAHIIFSNGIELDIEPGTAKEITYADTTKEGIIFYKFQTGFPSIDRQTGDNFYRILGEGRCSFIKSIFKKQVESKNVVFGEIAKEYETIEDYYLFAKGGMKKIKMDREFILAALSDKQTEMNEFTRANNTNFKNIDQLIKLFNYYNSL